MRKTKIAYTSPTNVLTFLYCNYTFVNEYTNMESYFQVTLRI